MRYVTCLLLIAWPTIGVAQQTPPAETNPGNVFVLTVDDAMIDALKKGMSLESQVPAEARGKFTTIRIQYKPSAAAPPANSILRNNETTQAPPNLGSGATGSSGWGNIPSNSPGSVTPPAPFNLGLPPTNPNPAAGVPNSQTQLTPPPLRLDQVAGGGAAVAASPITLPDGLRGTPWFSGNRPNTPPAPSGTPQLAATTAAGAPNTLNNFPQRSELPAGPTSLPNFPAAGLPPQASPPADYRNELVSATALDLQRSIAAEWNGGSIGLPPPPTANTPLRAETAAADRSPSDAVGRLPLPASDAEKTLLTKVNSLETANKTLEIQRKESTKWLLFLFLFLMCSLGANIYLGWIARGFYTRFHEMANELRDTFTSTAA